MYAESLAKNMSSNIFANKILIMISYNELQHEIQEKVILKIKSKLSSNVKKLSILFQGVNSDN